MKTTINWVQGVSQNTHICLKCMRDSSTAREKKKKSNKGVRVNARQMGISQQGEK